LTQFYHLSLKWTYKKDEAFQFWRPNNSGYTYLLEEAGIYPENKTNLSEGILSVPVDVINQFKQKVLNRKSKKTFHMCPNRGFIRKALGITVFDMNHKTFKNDFLVVEYSLFDISNEILETTKKEKTGLYLVKMKPNSFYDEEWFYSETFEAKNRNQAIMKAFKEWDGEYRCNGYLEFKNLLSVKLDYATVFDTWKAAA